MHKLLSSVAVAALACAAGGCTIYFGDGDDEPCELIYGDPVGLRNPETGMCESWGGGGYCDDQPLPGAPEADIAWPDWAYCPSQCEGLDEASCLGTPSCRAAYYQWVCPPNADCDIGELDPEFWGCWGVSQSGPVQGSCEGLDAYACSQHDDCVAVYVDDFFGQGNGRIFSYCAAEPGAPPPDECAAVDCAPGYECVTVCADADCLPEGPCPEPSCWAECVPVEPQDPGTCEGEVACDAAPPACPEGTTPGISGACWSGYCIPLSDCGPNDPGECFAPVYCDMATPSCPEGTYPGVSDGCYTGYCIPEWACPQY